MAVVEKLEAKVSIIGFINDGKFTAQGTGTIDGGTGKAHIQLEYSDCPPDWNTLNYSDPLVLLAGYAESDGGKNFASMASDGYDAESTFAFGAGMSLRKTASIRIEGSRIVANYAISGTVSAGHVSGVEDYEEYIVPVAKDQLIAVGLARWGGGGKDLEALVSTRYWLRNANEIPKTPMVRGFHVTPEPNKSRLQFSATYDTYIKSIGTRNLISDRVVRHGPYDRLQG
jgi:hypothetical protein